METRKETDDERELRELKEKTDAIHDARALRNLPTIGEQKAVAQRKLKEAEALDELEQKHGKQGVEIELVDSDIGAVIVKRPTMAVYRRFQDSGTVETKDLENLVRPCILYPSRAEFDQMLEQRPLLLKHVSDACVLLAGLRAKDVKAK